MNLNEQRLNAYKSVAGNSKKNGGNSEKSVFSDNGKKVQPFIPPRIQSEEKNEDSSKGFVAKPLFKVVNEKISDIFDSVKTAKDKVDVHLKKSGEKEKSFENKSFFGKSSDFQNDGTSKIGESFQNDVNSKNSFSSNNDGSYFSDDARFLENNSSNKSSGGFSGIVKVPETEVPLQKEDSVYRRVAKFLMIIGIDEAAKILPHLSSEQTEKIIPEIASIQSVDPLEASKILEEFHGLLEKARESGGKETARNILEKAYGSQKAEELLEKAAPFSGTKPFDYFNDADPERVQLLLKDENEGIQALVLSYLEPKKAASVLNFMYAEEKALVVRRLAKMESVSPEILKKIDDAMRKKSLAQTTEKAEGIDGRNALAQILKRMSPDAEKSILSNLAENDPELGHDLRERLFTIDDVINGDDRFIQEQLRTMDDLDVAKLLAFQGAEFRAKILSCISAGRRKNVLEEEKINSPFRKSDCDIMVNDFFTILRRAYEEGKFIIKNRDDEIYV